MGDKRKPVWPWATALLLGLPMAYIASFGPAVWLMRRDCISVETFCYWYGPAAKCFHRSPSGLKSAMIRCWNLGGASEIELFFLLSDAQHGFPDSVVAQ